MDYINKLIQDEIDNARLDNIVRLYEGKYELIINFDSQELDIVVPQLCLEDKYNIHGSITIIIEDSELYVEDESVTIHLNEELVSCELDYNLLELERRIYKFLNI